MASIPVLLTLKASDGSESIIYRTTEIWKDGDEEIWLEETTDGKKIKSIELGQLHAPHAPHYLQPIDAADFERRVREPWVEQRFQCARFQLALRPLED